MKRHFKTIIAAAIAAAVSPAFAGQTFLIDFEKSWDYGTAVDDTYASSGVAFTNFLGLSNDGLGSLDGGAYYLNAPSMLGVAFTQLDGVYNQTAYMNLSAGGVDNQLTLYYTSPVAISNAVTAYSGLNGTGSVLGTLDFAATDPAYSQWKKATLTFSGTALSFDFSATAYQSPDAPGAGIDNIAAIPEPETYAMLLAGLGLIGAAVKRQKAKQA